MTNRTGWHRTSWLGAAAGLALLASSGAAHAEWVASWTAAPHAPLGTEGPFAAAPRDPRLRRHL